MTWRHSSMKFNLLLHRSPGTLADDPYGGVILDILVMVRWTPLNSITSACKSRVWAIVTRSTGPRKLMKVSCGSSAQRNNFAWRGLLCLLQRLCASSRASHPSTIPSNDAQKFHLASARRQPSSRRTDSKSSLLSHYHRHPLVRESTTMAAAGSSEGGVAAGVEESDW